MNTTIANICALIIGFASAFLLMRDSDGLFALERAEGTRLALAFFLCFFGGWFTKSDSGAQLLTIDWIVMALLMTLALTAWKWPPVA